MCNYETLITMRLLCRSTVTGQRKRVGFGKFFAKPRNEYLYTDVRRLTAGIRPEKCVVRRFRRCANVIQCTYTSLDSAV